jgi:hypothetical protein
VLSTTEIIPESHIVELDDVSIDIEVEIIFSFFRFSIEHFYDAIDIESAKYEFCIFTIESPLL